MVIDKIAENPFFYLCYKMIFINTMSLSFIKLGIDDFLIIKEQPTYQKYKGAI